MFFEQYPEFISEDSRKKRAWSPVTAETLSKRHEVLAPKWLVEGNSVLDLGSCLGASGHWCLSQGARDYTGVELQPEMATKSNELLGKYWSQNKYQIVNKDIRTFLDEEIEKGYKYDVVLMLGVIYAFINTYEILEKISKICDYVVVIDGAYPQYMITPDAPIIHITHRQHINSDEEGKAYMGTSCVPSPNAVRFMFETLGFEDREGIIYPKPVSDLTMHDTYVLPSRRYGIKSYPTPSRYMIRFYNTKKFSAKELAKIVEEKDKSRLVPMANKPEQPKPWVFDGSVADRFQREAEIHIPDYERVIKMCVEIVENTFEDKDIKIIDVGSALGNTLEMFYTKGYTNVYGVESSEAMIAKSAYKSKITHSDKLPDGPWDVVLANWTLHFIHDRKEYLERTFNEMSENGLLVLTDKMNSTVEIDALYQKSKLDNGATPEEVEQKKQAIMGVLVTKPLIWYITTLHEIGFREIQVVNSKYMFNTIYARK